MIRQGDTVIVTGATGFLGNHVCNELTNRGYEVVKYSKNNSAGIKVDLRYKPDIFRVEDKHYKPKALINLAATVGGIGANQKNPATFMLDSLLIGTNVVENCLHSRSMQDGGKLVQISTVCSYPKFTPVPFRETDIWNGYPEETNAAYGIAKKAIMELIKAYNYQYKGKFKGITLIPTNLYGPGDNFNPESSHVIPAIILKVGTAISNAEKKVELWGTGNASREFLFVKDAARGIVDAMVKYEGDDPVNLGTGQEITIKVLSELIAEKMGYDGEIVFDQTKPDGQPRRCLDVTKAKQEFGFEATIPFEKGLEDTIDWFRRSKYGTSNNSV